MTKYYVVRNGRKPGIYNTWEECKAQTHGFPGAVFKSFPTLEEARIFLDGKRVPRKIADEPQMFISHDAYAFIDGSFNVKTGTYGYGGFLAYGPSRYYLTGSGNDPNMTAMRNVAGEIEGAMAAVLKAEELGLPSITILYDYAGIENWATGNWRTNKFGTADYYRFMNSPERKVKVTFRKVTAHTGVEGNEIADAMAKQAVGIQLTKKQKTMLEQHNYN